MIKPRSLLFLNRKELLELGASDMTMVLPLVRQVFKDWHEQNVLQPAKTSLAFNETDGLVNILPAAIRDDQGTIFGLKAFGTMPSNVASGIPMGTGVMVLFDGATKTPEAVMDAQVISAMRTGAVSALAAEKLCRPESKTLGLIGAGVNMRTQLLGILAVLPDISLVRVFSRGKSKETFVSAMQKRFPRVVFQVATSAADAVTGADIVVTCVTNTDTPVVSAADLQAPGIAVFNIGAIENELQLLSTMDLIVSDHWDYAKHRGGQTHSEAYKQGIISDSNVVDLNDILNGQTQGRANNEQRIFFSSTGLGMGDLVIARALLERAMQAGAGTLLTLWDNDEWI